VSGSHPTDLQLVVFLIEMENRGWWNSRRDNPQEDLGGYNAAGCDSIDRADNGAADVTREFRFCWLRCQQLQRTPIGMRR
jgi:hypothetical protein